MPKQNTTLEASGAEFLVLGLLLIEGIDAFKAYTNFPGYDVIAVDPKTGTQCKIQVKSRWATDENVFPISNLDCDFVVYVALNRGYRRPRKQLTGDGKANPQFYVFPIGIIHSIRDTSTSWGNVYLRRIPSLSQYLNRWDLIRDKLALQSQKSL
jgi:hypothetical protein